MTTETTRNPEEIGRFVGRAIARDVLREGMPREWTGLDSQDTDAIVAAGLPFGSAGYLTAEREAEAEYRRRIGD